MKPLPIVGALVALRVAAWYLARSSDTPEPPAPAADVAGDAEGPDRAAPPRAAAPPDPSEVRGDEGPPPAPPAAIEFDALPPSHHPGAVLPRVALVEAALREGFPHAKVEMRDAECASAPCILGFDYDAPAVAAGDGGARGFHQATRAAFEEHLGYPVTSMHIDDVADGKQIWMFAVPPEIERSDPLRNRLIETGHHRHAALLGERGAR